MSYTADDLAREARWEQIGVERGVRAFEEASAAAKEAGALDAVGMAAAHRLLVEFTRPLAEAIEAMKTEALDAVTKRGRPKDWNGALGLLDAKQTAVITILGACRGAMEDGASAEDMTDAGMAPIALSIAQALRDQVEFETWAESQREVAEFVKEEKAEAHKENRLAAVPNGYKDLLRKFEERHKGADRKTWSRFRSNIKVARSEPWDKLKVAIPLGLALLDALVRVAPGYFEIKEKWPIKGHAASLNVLVGSEALREELRDLRTKMVVSRPALMPMVIPPVPWRYNEKGQAEGGYLMHRSVTLIRAGLHAHTAALERPISEPDLAAINAVQATPWRINRFTLDVALHAWHHDIAVPAVCKALTKPRPDRLEEVAWKAMDDDAKKKHRMAMAALHSYNASVLGRERALTDVLAVAQELQDEPEFYYPHTRCFRGRIHPTASTGPNPQGNDIAKGMLMFATGVPLGARGFYWLLVRAANCAGQDKLSLDDRVRWAVDHKDEIIRAGTEPFASSWWSAVDEKGDPVMDEPWGLLATCHELAQAWALEDPTQFVSHLPVPLDGTCNGLQHLSAMLLDPAGATATNLSADPQRHDIYLEVRDIVRAIVRDDAAKGVPGGLAWHGKLEGGKGRKVVKRGVMTTPYGVTERGIKMQLIKDKRLEDITGDGDLAGYITDHIVTAIETVVASSKDVKAWLQTVAASLSKAGMPFEWKTPTGSTVRQAYRVQTVDRVRTLCGRVNLNKEVQNGALTDKKQALGSSPNFIHSFDASHLALTVNEAVAEGVRSFALIHDSYGVHAANTDILANALRSTFVSIYREDWLAKTADYIADYASHVELPPVPARGRFDLEEVLRSPFFFS